MLLNDCIIFRLNELDYATLAIGFAAALVSSDGISANHSLTSIKNVLHATMAFSLLPIQKDVEIRSIWSFSFFIRLLLTLQTIGLSPFVVILSLSLKKLISNDDTINCVAHLENCQHECDLVVGQLLLLEHIEYRTCVDPVCIVLF